MISFTFYDFPTGALAVAVKFLSVISNRARTTWSMGLTEISQHGVPLHSTEDISLAMGRGHEGRHWGCPGKACAGERFRI